MQPITTASIITILVFISFVTEIVPIPVTAVCGAILMGVFGVADFSTVFSGFANDVTLTIIGTSIVGAALFEVNLVGDIGRLISKKGGKTEKEFIVILIVVSALLSALLSNIAVTAMFVPIVANIAVNSNGSISAKNTMMFVGIASGVGGLITLIGSPPQLLANGMLKNAGLEEFSFFEFAYVGIPLLILLIIYALTLGYSFISKVKTEETNAKIEGLKNITDDNAEAKSIKSKKVKALIVLCLMVVGFCTQIWTIGTVAMVAGMLMIISGCITWNKSLESIDWTSAITIAGALGFATALEKSGVCQLIANKTVDLVGADANVVVYVLVLVFLCAILTNIISNVACTTVFVPIAISLAATTGYAAKVLVLAVVFGASISWATPIAAPPMTMVLKPGNYKFNDYLKVGGLFCVISCIVTIIILVATK